MISLEGKLQNLLPGNYALSFWATGISTLRLRMLCEMCVNNTSHIHRQGHPGGERVICPSGVTGR